MRTEENGQPYFDTPVSLIRYFLQGSIGVFVLSMLFASAVSDHQFYSGQRDR